VAGSKDNKSSIQRVSGLKKKMMKVITRGNGLERSFQFEMLGSWGSKTVYVVETEQKPSYSMWLKNYETKKYYVNFLKFSK
jgi:hypothetical protein